MYNCAPILKELLPSSEQKSVLWHLEAERAPSRSIGQSCQLMQINVVAWISLLFGATFKLQAARHGEL